VEIVWTLDFWDWKEGLLEGAVLRFHRWQREGVWEM
jgi:hypothetical protein